jgi:predicted nucleic acid-binding protein
MRYLLDSNTVMNAAFIKDSVARRAASSLRSQEHTILIDEMTWQEILRVIERKRRELRLAYDPAPMLSDYVDQLNVIFVPPGDPAIDVSPVNRSDRHIVRAAITNDANILTDDHPLIVECRRCGVSALTTSAALRLPGAQDPGKHRGPSVLGLAQTPRALQGYYLMWFGPVNYGQANTTSCHTLFDAINRACVYYDGPRREWAAVTDDGVRVAMHAEPVELMRGAICFTYKYDPNSRQPNTVRLMFGMRGAGVRQQTMRPLGNRLASLPQGGLSFFADRNQQNHGMGGIQQFHSNVGLVSRETFQAVVDLDSLWISLENADLLDPALKLIARSHRGGWLLPVEDDLR